MTPEATDTLILAFTSKTEQSVARYTHQIFLFGFFQSEIRYIYAFYKPNFQLMTERVRKKELNKEKILHF